MLNKDYTSISLGIVIRLFTACIPLINMHTFAIDRCMPDSALLFNLFLPTYS